MAGSRKQKMEEDFNQNLAMKKRVSDSLDATATPASYGRDELIRSRAPCSSLS
jgi:hypothetical protein